MFKKILDVVLCICRLNVHLPAVRSWAPAAVRVCHQPAAQHELLVLLHEHTVIEYHADVMGVEAL